MNIRHRVLVEENVGNQLLNLRLVSKQRWLEKHTLECERKESL